jgi:hypothetical protein
MDFAVRGGQFAAQASKDYDSAKLFEVIFDRIFYIEDVHGPRGHGFIDHIKFKRHTRYENNSNDINNGVLTCLVFGNNNTNNAGNPLVRINTEVYFVDN